MTRPVALVTGANRGIGRATAEALAGRGFDTVCADLAETPDTAETLRLCAEAGGRHRFAALHIAAIQAEAGPIACLVNIAGVQTPHRGDMLDATAADYDRVLGVNLRGTFFLTQAVARLMLAEPPRPLDRDDLVVQRRDRLPADRALLPLEDRPHDADAALRAPPGRGRDRRLRDPPGLHPHGP